MATVELRLVDINGYTVLDSRAVTRVPDDQAETEKARLLAELAPQDADAWDQPLYGYRVTTTAV